MTAASKAASSVDQSVFLLADSKAAWTAEWRAARKAASWAGSKADYLAEYSAGPMAGSRAATKAANWAARSAESKDVQSAVPSGSLMVVSSEIHLVDYLDVTRAERSG